MFYCMFYFTCDRSLSRKSSSYNGQIVCVFVFLSVIPAGAFCAAWTPPLTPLLAFMGHNGLTPMPSPTNPSPSSN